MLTFPFFRRRSQKSAEVADTRADDGGTIGSPSVRSFASIQSFTDAQSSALSKRGKSLITAFISCLPLSWGRYNAT